MSDRPFTIADIPTARSAIYDLLCDLYGVCPADQSRLYKVDRFVSALFPAPAPHVEDRQRAVDWVEALPGYPRCPKHPSAPMRRFADVARCSECGDGIEFCGVAGFKDCWLTNGHAGNHTSRTGTSWPGAVYRDPPPVAAREAGAVVPVVGMVVQWADGTPGHGNCSGPAPITSISDNGTIRVERRDAGGGPYRSPLCSTDEFTEHVRAGTLIVVSPPPPAAPKASDAGNTSEVDGPAPRQSASAASHHSRPAEAPQEPGTTSAVHWPAYLPEGATMKHAGDGRLACYAKDGAWGCTLLRTVAHTTHEASDGRRVVHRWDAPPTPANGSGEGPDFDVAAIQRKAAAGRIAAEMLAPKKAAGGEKWGRIYVIDQGGKIGGMYFHGNQPAEADACTQSVGAPAVPYVPESRLREALEGRGVAAAERDEARRCLAEADATIARLEKRLADDGEPS